MTPSSALDATQLIRLLKKMRCFLPLLGFTCTAQASDMGSPGLWFAVFLVASFLHAGTLYLLTALVFLTRSKQTGSFNRAMIYGVPSAIILLSLLVFAVAGLANEVTVPAVLMGWGAAFVLHRWAMLKWQSHLAKQASRSSSDTPQQ